MDKLYKCSISIFQQECCLCCMRGGALKPTTDGKWAHVVCALTITEIKFDNILKREPINIDGIISNRVKLVSTLLIPIHVPE